MRILHWIAGVGVLGVLSTAAVAQLPGGCGKPTVEYKVKTQKNAQPAAAPGAGMAQVVFVESLSEGFPNGPTVRFGSDGEWLGATKGPSYFVVNVTAGDHTVCGSRQGGSNADRGNVAALKLHLKEGSVTYVEFHLNREEVGSAAMQGGAQLPGQYPGSLTAKEKPTVDVLTFKEVAAGDAQSLMKKLPMSTATTK